MMYAWCHLERERKEQQDCTYEIGETDLQGRELLRNPPQTLSLLKVEGNVGSLF